MAKLNYSKLAMKAGGIAGGVIVAELVDSKLLGNKVSPLLKSLGKIGIGLIVPELMKGKSKEFVTHVGDGFIAAGTRQLVTVAVPGIFDVPPAEPPVEGIGEDTAYVTDEVADDVSGLENADGLGAVENAGGLAGDEEDYE
jgi:hypothetical protein